MKLSEGLLLRADIQKRIEGLRERLKASALVQEGERPAEDPATLFAELDRVVTQLTGLIGAINRTNLNTRLEGGRTLTEALAQRDVLRLRQSVLRSVADAAAGRMERYSRTEIRSVPTVDVGGLRREIDSLAQQYRELDTTIQAANWATELLE